LTPGQLVWVPLRKKLVPGVILRLHDEAPAFATRPLHAAADPPVVLDPARLAAGRWLSRETASSPFAALSPFLPPGRPQRVAETLHLIDPAIDRAELTPTQRRLVDLLAERGDLDLDAARAALGSSLATVVPALERRGAIERTARVATRSAQPRRQRFIRLAATDAENAEPDRLERAPRQRAVIDYLAQRARRAPAADGGLVSLADLLARTGTDHAVVGALARKGLVEEIAAAPAPRPVEPAAESFIPALTLAQAAAWRAIAAALERRDPTPMLLHGVTGSGKTEIYLRAVAWCLRQGRGAIVLVPEIALASQIVRRFTARFPGAVAVLHSALSERERLAAWHGVAAGERRLVVGPRSALFAPVADLGLIVIDEEHEPAYKQDAEPRYHARALAERLAADCGAALVLGSATPSVETFWRADTGSIGRLELPERVGMAGDRTGAALELPPVEVVDQRLELHRGNASLLSEPLQDLLSRTLANREQAILLLNRRGMSTVVLCKTCGATLRCPFCDIPLVFHADRGLLLCHRCDHRERPPAACPGCRGPLNYFGAGTQRVEEEARRLFPGARILRWDYDVVRRERGHEGLLRRVERREVDILVGTQMIAKGLDLPLVTAIGVVNADTMLHLPDFRSGERTFQLLTQVAGRAGRRAPGSQVIVQSYTPDHYAIQAAARHDYNAFFAEEIDFRRSHGYPPFSRLVRYLFRHRSEAACAAAADQMARRLARHARDRAAPMELLGPTPAFASRVRGDYQWQIVLKTDDLEPLLDGLPDDPGWTVDIDPQSLL
ncbi:MAG TPA: primosomal protein N', partial [Thermomicrobiales bacterium]|nr:primosomal protein N' [Thermomicrobiales bacterium]